MARQSPPRAHVQVAPEQDSKVKRLRDGRRFLAPVTATCTPIESDNLPTLEIRIDVHDGRIVVVEARLIASTEHPLRSDEVRSWSLPKMATLALSLVSVTIDPETGAVEPVETEPSAVIRAVRARESASVERLHEVARLFDLGGIEAVIKGAHVSRSQAYRLVKQAREARMIEGDS